MKHPLIRYHGSKWRLYPWLRQFFPEHTRYVEPFGGGGGVLLQKPQLIDEVYNDLDSEIGNVFRVVQDESQREKLIELLLFTPYSRDEFDRAWLPVDCQIEKAKNTMVKAHMGFSSAGATRLSPTGFRCCSRKKESSAVHLWQRYPVQMQAFGKRLSTVIVENRPAIDLVPKHDDEETFFYCDPPYLPETRVQQSDGRHAYRCEMTPGQHEQFLHVARKLKGTVIISGYDSDMYNDILSGWEKHSTESRIAAGRGTAKRIENIWCNPASVERRVLIKLPATSMNLFEEKDKGEG